MNTPTQPTTHVPPQALEFEATVLGAAMLESYATTQVLELLTEQAFYKREHQLIFAAIRDVATETQAVDQLTVVQHLRAKSLLERAGGMAYVAGLTMSVSSAAHVVQHAFIVRQEHIRRVTLAAVTGLQYKVYDKSVDPLDLAADAIAEITQVLGSYEQHAGGTVADQFESVFEKLRKDVLNPGLTGLPTGLMDLNDATGGWQPGDLIIIAARPSMGKTAKMLHAMRAACLDHDNYAAIFSLEMPAMQLIQRLVAAEAEGYSVSKLRRGQLDGGVDEVASIREKALRLKLQGHRVMIEDGSTLTIQQLRAKCLRLHQQHPLGLVMVDYIQLMEGPQKSKGAGNREQEIAAISRGLKKLAKELNVPVIALSQLSREVEKRVDKRPQLSDLRESGAIEQDADIKKNRNGKLGEVHVGCDLDRGLLYDLGSEPAELAETPAYGPLRISDATHKEEYPF